MSPSAGPRHRPGESQAPGEILARDLTSGAAPGRLPGKAAASHGKGAARPAEGSKAIAGRWFTEFRGPRYDPDVIDELAEFVLPHFSCVLAAVSTGIAI